MPVPQFLLDLLQLLLDLAVRFARWPLRESISGMKGALTSTSTDVSVSGCCGLSCF